MQGSARHWKAKIFRSMVAFVEHFWKGRHRDMLHFSFEKIIEQEAHGAMASCMLNTIKFHKVEHCTWLMLKSPMHSYFLLFAPCKGGVPDRHYSHKNRDPSM